MSIHAAVETNDKQNVGENLLVGLAVSRSYMLADREAMDTPETRTNQIVHIRCDMTSIWVERAAKREREKVLLFSRISNICASNMSAEKFYRAIETNKCG